MDASLENVTERISNRENAVSATIRVTNKRSSVNNNLTT